MTWPSEEYLVRPVWLAFKRSAMNDGQMEQSHTLQPWLIILLSGSGSAGLLLSRTRRGDSKLLCHSAKLGLSGAMLVVLPGLFGGEYPMIASSRAQSSAAGMADFSRKCSARDLDLVEGSDCKINKTASLLPIRQERHNACPSARLAFAP